MLQHLTREHGAEGSVRKGDPVGVEHVVGLELEVDVRGHDLVLGESLAASVHLVAGANHQERLPGRHLGQSSVPFFTGPIPRKRR